MNAIWPEVIILRHGETEWNREDRLQGALNSPLTSKGLRQARRQGELLERFDLTGWNAFSSPQGRAIQTAGLSVATRVDFVSTDDRLREIGVGQWAGVRRSDLKYDQDQPRLTDDPYQLYKLAPEGEGFDALEQRCRAFLADLTGPAVLVTHGITSRMLRIVLLDLPRSELGHIAGGQGNLFHLKSGVQKEIV